MKLPEVMAALRALGRESIKKVLLKHGAKEPFFGVRIGDMKPLAKQLKGRQELALQLYDTGNGDAQYLAGMIADGRLMTTAQLDHWVKTAAWDMISGTTVPWVASEHPDGAALALKWIGAKNEQIARAGWNTLGALAATRSDAELPLKEYARLLKSLPRDLPKASDGVRYTMNNFIIACGTYLAPLAEQAIATARAIGRVQVDMGDTECKVPDAESYILKSRRGAPIAPKRKTVRC
ncbi:DNA alkylation repair protein [Oleiharenicola lentus]|uniref:DNA alkylation repair protein n=1 Tax=Oleiharenicola lentus TaxID=2508720 RepID=A0A4Q1CB63_9BACT|nr:DNA alkylation repair protein [Oleiharenicola lentus]RXK56141.1 DNA alkylation repair protein [Oleiharenicola lentus]